MSEAEDYNGESEDYKSGGGETPITGDDVTGDEGLLEIEIPAARYGDGKVATAQDSDLTAGNIKKDVVIFGVTGTLEAGGTAKGRFYPCDDLDDGQYAGGAFSQTNTWLSAGKDNSNIKRHYAVLFKRITIPQDATITKAHLELYSSSAQSGADCDLKIFLNDEDCAVMPTDGLIFNALSLTDGVCWAALPSWAISTWYNSIEIKTEIQAIVDRVGWALDNDLLVIVKDDGSPSGSRRNPTGHEVGSGGDACRLYIEWAV